MDLHVHTALSPCAAAEMVPPTLLLAAEQGGVALLGVVDHSSAGNAAAVLEARPAFDVAVLVGLEVESVEGVHLLALFATAEAATAFEALLATHLPPVPNRPDLFGDQMLVNEWGAVVGTEPRLLAVAADLGVEEIADLIVAHQGLSIAAHIDRTANGLLPTLGFVPPRLHLDGLELSRFTPPSVALARWPELRGQPLLQSSDAHCLAEIGRGRTLVPAALGDPGNALRDWGQTLAEFLREVTSRHA